jgi:hypothetical protein
MYQVQSRTQVGNGTNWNAVGAPILAVSSTTLKLDASGINSNRFYRVQVLP